MAEPNGVKLVDEESFDFDPGVVDSFALDIADFRGLDGVEYPAVLLSNVLFMDCLRVLQSQKKSSYRELPVWIELPDGDGFQDIGSLQLDSDILLAMRHLRITVTLYYSKDDMETLDLENPETYLKFI